MRIREQRQFLAVQPLASADASPIAQSAPNGRPLQARQGGRDVVIDIWFCDRRRTARHHRSTCCRAANPACAKCNPRPSHPARDLRHCRLILGSAHDATARAPVRWRQCLSRARSARNSVEAASIAAAITIASPSQSACAPKSRDLRGSRRMLTRQPRSADWDQEDGSAVGTGPRFRGSDDGRNVFPTALLQPGQESLRRRRNGSATGSGDCKRRR